MLLAGAAVHLFTVANARHRLLLEFVALALAGCRFRPAGARRTAWACAALAAAIAIGLLSPGRAQLLEVLSSR